MVKPIPGDWILNALRDKNTIVLACNTRIIKGVTRGLLKAAKKIDAPVFIQIARSECDMNGGYIGLTPMQFAKMTMNIADEIGNDVWALHADHIGIKKGTPEEIISTKELILNQINAGFTSFAIDASHLYNFSGKNVYEELSPNIAVTIDIARFILEEIKNKRGKDFGLEVEVGEIGKKDKNGSILTTKEEALTFVSELNRAGIYPQVLAINNGTSHGNVFDEKGNQISKKVDIERTNEIAEELKKNNISTRIAQHGTTGTPRAEIYSNFPHGNILKCNVGTFWQNIFYEVLKETNPKLYKEIREWVISTYKTDAEKKSIKTEEQLVGVYIKNATKQFFDKIYGIDIYTEQAVEARVYAEALVWFKVFKAEGTARLVKEYISKKV